MVVRGNFVDELDELKTQLLELGTLAKTALEQSIEALKEQDIEKALKVIDYDAKINKLEEEINEKAIWLIAKEQPVATDLRRLIVTLKITTDVERIGDYSVNIAKSVILIGEKTLIKPLEEIPKMASIATKMIEDVLQAYYDEDVVAARNVAEIDDEVDSLYGKLIQELMGLTANNPENISQVTQLAFICRYLERVADHTTNISEGIIYLVKGKRYDLNT